MPQSKVERSVLSGLANKEIEKVPLGNQRDKLAASRNMTETRRFKRIASENSSRRGYLLVRQFQKFFQEPEFVKQLERGRMHSVAPEIAEEIVMLFENRDLYSGAGKQVAEHYAGRAATHEATRGFQDAMRHAY
jgi:hypothetical protein